MNEKSLDELEKVMPMISENSQYMFVGGSSSSNCPVFCVFNCFDYLDGNQYDACNYYTEFEK